MTEKTDYNKMYDLLVTSNEDIVGLLAYGIYKRHKRNFIIEHKKKHGSRPNDEEMDNFMTFALSQQDRYKKDGSEVFFQTVGNAVQKEYEKSDEHKRFVDNIVNAAQTEFDKIERAYEGAVDKIVSKHSFCWYSTVGLNLLSTVLFSVLLGIGYFLLHTSEKSTNDAMDQMMGKSAVATSLPSDSIKFIKR